jgi:hypothetical protein
MITEKQKQLGNRWATIARLLPGRSAGSVKNRWYSGLNALAQSAGFDIFEPMNLETVRFLIRKGNRGVAKICFWSQMEKREMAVLTVENVITMKCEVGFGGDTFRTDVRQFASKV